MSRSFQIVEFKIAEAEFFLDKIEQCTLGTFQLFEIRNYLSAFLSSSRSITFALQASMSDVAGFEKWYAGHQDVLRKNSLAKYFLEARNASQKVGYYPIERGVIYRDACGQKRTNFFFVEKHGDISIAAPQEDSFSCCKTYFTTLLTMVFDCYTMFGPIIDPEQYFSFENICKTGKTIEDFEEELGYPREWTKIPGANDDDRLKIIQSEVKYDGIDHILIKYLNKDRFGNMTNHV